MPLLIMIGLKENVALNATIHGMWFAVVVSNVGMNIEVLAQDNIDLVQKFIDWMMITSFNQ